MAFVAMTEGEPIFGCAFVKPCVGEGFYPSRRFCIILRAG